MEPTVRACEAVDAGLGEIYSALKRSGGSWLVTTPTTANAETMIDPDYEGSAHLPHNQSCPVYFI